MGPNMAEKPRSNRISLAHQICTHGTHTVTSSCSILSIFIGKVGYAASWPESTDTDIIVEI